MKFNNIRVSSRSTHVFGTLKTTTGLASETLSRFSICLSLGQEGIPNPDEYNKDGTEFSPERIFGEHEKIYLALMLDRLKHDRLDPDHYLDEMTRAHINRGAISLKQRVKSLSDFYRLLGMV